MVWSLDMIVLYFKCERCSPLQLAMFCTVRFTLPQVKATTTTADTGVQKAVHMLWVSGPKGDSAFCCPVQDLAVIKVQRSKSDKWIYIRNISVNISVIILHRVTVIDSDEIEQHKNQFITVMLASTVRSLCAGSTVWLWAIIVLLSNIVSAFFLKQFINIDFCYLSHHSHCSSSSLKAWAWAVGRHTK